MTERQNMYLDDLLKQVGFLNNDKRNKYAWIIKDSHSEVVEKTHERGFNSSRGLITKTFSEFVTSYRSVIELVKDEIELKKNKNSLKLKSKEHVISATDYANYAFCPVSYIINKTFIIESLSNSKKITIGESLHNRNILLWKKSEDGFDEHRESVFRNKKIQKIRNSKLIFSGHNNKNNYFENREENFVGQPDYIFETSSGEKFIVEEKFRYFKSEEKHSDKKEYQKSVMSEKRIFYENHIIQLQAYLNYIKEYDFKFGILIYWFYDFPYQSSYPFIHNFALKVIYKDKTKVSNIKNQIKKLYNAENLKFKPPGLNKCGNCSVLKYCGHKAEIFNDVSYPYKKEYLRLYVTKKSEAFKKIFKKNKYI